MATQNPARKAAEEDLLKHLKMMEPAGTNAQRYAEMFAAMDDAQFEDFVQRLESDAEQVFIYVPNMVVHLKMEDIIATAHAVGVELFEHLRLYDAATKRYYTTPEKYFVVEMPVRRLKQYWKDKISVPDSDTKTDVRTGQVTKPDKGSSMSVVEMQTLDSKGLHYSLAEFITVRGGNVHAYASFKSHLMESGAAVLDEVDMTGKVRSALIGQVMMQAMMLDNNLAGDDI